MKVAIVFILLFATVLCRPARRVFDSSSESSEEVMRRPVARYMRKQAPVVPQTRVAVVQKVAAASDESKDSTDEVMVAAEAPVLQFKSDSLDATLAPDTTTDGSLDSDDSDEDDDTNESENDEDDDEDESSDSSESGESSTVAPTTASPTVVTEEPVAETTEDYIDPTVITDDSARGDSLGGYPSDYKSIYVEDKSYHKVPAPYKSYEYYDTGKKSSYDTMDGNEVEKSLKVYKVQALQVHSELLEGDTSTPEVETQGLEGQDQDVSPRQASLPEEADGATTIESKSSSATQEEEEEDESTSAANDSASAESEDDESQSSEEATATPGASDSDSDESDSEEGTMPDASTDMPVVITAK